MKETMRDKVHFLIGYYQAEEDFCRKKVSPVPLSEWPGAEAVKAECCREFLEKLKWLLEEE